MGKTYKEQATYDYLHDNKEVKGKLLYAVKKYFNRLNCNKWDSSRISWYRHKLRIKKIFNNIIKSKYKIVVVEHKGKPLYYFLQRRILGIWFDINKENKFSKEKYSTYTEASKKIQER